jgi:hypothetical protein
MRLEMANAAFVPCSTVRLMEDPVWHRIDRELVARRVRHRAPGTWADIARVLETTEQRVNNWKRRGVPTAQYAALAAALGWSVDYLIGVADDEALPREAADGKTQKPLTEAQQIAALYADLSPTERRRFLHLLAAAQDDSPALGDNLERLWNSRSTKDLIDESAPSGAAGKKRRLG